MFYAMQQIKDEYNPKLWHIRAIRTKSFKTLEVAKRIANKVSSRNVKGFVIDQHRNIIV